MTSAGGIYPRATTWPLITSVGNIQVGYCWSSSGSLTISTAPLISCFLSTDSSRVIIRRHLLHFFGGHNNLISGFFICLSVSFFVMSSPTILLVIRILPENNRSPFIFHSSVCNGVRKKFYVRLILCDMKYSPFSPRYWPSCLHYHDRSCILEPIHRHDQPSHTHY